MDLRRPVAVALLTVLVTPAGCAEEPDTPPATPSQAQVRPLATTIVTQTSVGGRVAPQAVRLDDAAALDRFAEPFTSPRMAAAVREVADRLSGPDRATWAAVVAVGCESPTAVRVRRVGDGVEIRAREPASGSSVQCLAPATSVAVVALPAGSD